MFESKYKKVLKILDNEIEINQNCYNVCARIDYDCIEDLKIRNELLNRKIKFMRFYLRKLETLRDLKIRFLEEIGE